MSAIQRPITVGQLVSIQEIRRNFIIRGVICGFLDGKDFKSALEFGVAASALKHTIPGDLNLVTRSDVDTLAGGDGSGRVQR